MDFSANIETNTSEVEKLSLLPRSAWDRQLPYFKALFKAKQALDKTYGTVKK
ncbi:hypothetical protein NIES2100_18750 [Calothrix sp. NIES-2100]|uniref:hypothetical protein n=1 Tax=Calothrix sp. NIES-2100 TaxID=1954172 RepID=UPI000B61327D|nr:hypothetical protein NIES2100_18750 [Calothrix sp. NIES-2100]